MKLVTFQHTMGCDRLGLLVNNKVVDLALAGTAYQSETHNEIPCLPADMLFFLNQGDSAIEVATRILQWVNEIIGKTGEVKTSTGELISFELDKVRLRAPVLRPPKILCLALNYQAHGNEVKTTMPENPYIFIKPGIRPVVGLNDKVFRPSESKNLVYEGELAVVIGKCCRHVPADKAYEVIAGYTVVNDMSARDFGATGTPGRFDWFRVKAFDSSCPMGPCLTLKDEIQDPHSLRLQTRVNGKTVQDASTGEMIHKIPDIIKFVSDYITLDPGDIIATGTPGGSKIALKDGDVVSVEISNIGTLSNTIAVESVMVK